MQFTTVIYACKDELQCDMKDWIVNLKKRSINVTNIRTLRKRVLETLKSNSRKQFLDLEIHFRNCKELIYVLTEFQFINISVKDLNEMP